MTCAFRHPYFRTAAQQQREDSRERLSAEAVEFLRQRSIRRAKIKGVIWHNVDTNLSMTMSHQTASH